ncbi:MAG: hypothetical protein KGI41_02915 [Patescibacteria group bacterium]|nr:hypothetical protein [Patescibacteria group bacterium]MDE1966165.1 hypothetical protein [Patescibacteria group bacterium]
MTRHVEEGQVDTPAAVAARKEAYVPRASPPIREVLKILGLPPEITDPEQLVGRQFKFVRDDDPAGMIIGTIKSATPHFGDHSGCDSITIKVAGETRTVWLTHYVSEPEARRPMTTAGKHTVFEKGTFELT